MLENDSFPGLLVDFISLAAGFGEIFGRRFMAIAQQNHRLVIRIGTFIKFMGRDADNLPLSKLVGFVAPLHDAFASQHVVGPVRGMIVHSLHVSGWEEENPGVEIFSAKKILATLAFLTFLSHFQHI